MSIDPPESPVDVLVVDDDDDIRSAVQELLAEEGYSSEGAANGKVALELLRASQNRPALILLDLMMPEMDGWTLLVRLQEDPTLRQVPVAIMSAHPSVRSAFEDRETSFASFFLLPKPVDLSRLLAIVSGVRPAPVSPS